MALLWRLLTLPNSTALIMSANSMLKHFNVKSTIKWNGGIHMNQVNDRICELYSICFFFYCANHNIRQKSWDCENEIAFMRNKFQIPWENYTKVTDKRKTNCLIVHYIHIQLGR